MRVFSVLAGLLLALSGGAAGDGPVAPVGSKVENLAFKDIRYLPRTLDDLEKPEKPKAFVITFITNSCPLAQRYLGRLIEMDAEFGPKGAQFLAVNVGPADTIMDMALHALEYGVEFPVVKDMTGDCVRALGITRTPETVVLDADRVVRYRGRVDDQYRLGGVRPEPSRADLRIALEELLAGKEVSVPTTQAEGCSVTLPSVPEPAAPVTYTEHIAPIINQHCLVCHRQDGGAPMRFDTFRRVTGYAEMIAEVVHEGRMPPWYAHPDHGVFENAPGITAEDRLRVRQWVAAGMPEGDPDKLPEPPVFPEEEWAFAPDMILTAPQQFVLPATGIVDYKYMFFNHVFEQDTWVQGIQIKGTNPRVTHHANLFYTPQGLQFARSENFLTGTVPGGVPASLKDGQAFFIPKGAKLGLQLHYVTTGKVEVDRPRVALRFAKEPVRKRLYYKILDEPKFAIPPFARAHRVAAVRELEADATVTGLFGHLHVRGRDMTIRAILPDGTDQILIVMPNYNFDWQLGYYTEPDAVQLPKGTKIECVTHFDNSPFNAYNPDPAKTVRYGAQTYDEMMQGFMFYTRNDEDLNLLVDPETGWAIGPMAAATEQDG